MSMLKVGVIVVMAIVASLVGLHFMPSPSHPLSQTGTQNGAIIEGNGGKHYSLDLNESVNVEGTP